MANPEHLKNLKSSVTNWNEWMRNYPHPNPDLAGANLANVELEHVNLYGADLRGANLAGANLMHSDLSIADLSEASLLGANLLGAKLFGVSAYDATFENADLTFVDFTRGHLQGANLRNSKLLSTHFHLTDLEGTDFAGAQMSFATFNATDLSRAKGLETISHNDYSSIGTDSLYLSQARIPFSFLRAAGVEEDLIDYVRRRFIRLLGSYLSTVIFYSMKDSSLVDRLKDDLRKNGVTASGLVIDLVTAKLSPDKMVDAIDMVDRVILVISKSSIESANSKLVSHLAFKKEMITQRPMLIPIQIDEESRLLAMQYLWQYIASRPVLDFRRWEQPKEYRIALDGLLESLKKP